jgi:transcriptional regulator with XRE-family HTH domain
MTAANKREMTDGAPNVGPIIRARRRQLNLTLQSIADASGISVGYLSQVERAQATPSLGSMERISKALDVNLDYFIATPKALDALTRKGGRATFFVGDSSIAYERIGADFSGNQLSSFVLTIPPGYHSETVSHEGEEIVYILEGALMQIVGGQEMELHVGDSLHFRSNTKHKWWNDSDQPVKIFWVGTANIFRA